MTEPARRSDKELVRDVAIALTDARSSRGWSRKELVRQIDRLPSNIRFGYLPSVEDVEEMEAAKPKKLPPWLRLARMAFEQAELPPAQHGNWLNHRQWYRPGYAIGDPGDMACPWVFRDEFLMLERLSLLNDESRALAFRLVSGLARAEPEVIGRVITQLEGLLRGAFEAAELGQGRDEGEA